MSRSIAVDFFKTQSDNFPLEIHESVPNLRAWFFHDGRKWWEIYDFVEFFIGSYSKHFGHAVQDKEYKDLIFIKELNLVLEQENSGYRIIDNTITPIIERQEYLRLKPLYPIVTSI
jgi:hypothetical protein